MSITPYLIKSKLFFVFSCSLLGIFLKTALPTIFTRLKCGFLLFGLFISPNDASLGQIIRGQLDGYFITRQDTDEIHPKLSADVSQNDVFVLQLYFEHGVG